MPVTTVLASLAATVAIGAGAALGITSGTDAEVPAPAAASDAAADTQRVDLACDRLPNLLLRAENLSERLAADAGTPGSLAWLDARAEAAQAAGRDDLATALRNRLEVRSDLAALLPDRIARLEQAQAWCADH